VGRCPARLELGHGLSDTAWILEMAVALRGAGHLLAPSLHYRLHNRILEIAVELPVWIVGLNHQDSNHLLFRINPEVRSKRAAHP
jgi:hypothetical protein